MEHQAGWGGAVRGAASSRALLVAVAVAAAVVAAQLLFLLLLWSPRAGAPADGAVNAEVAMPLSSNGAVSRMTLWQAVNSTVDAAVAAAALEGARARERVAALCAQLAAQGDARDVPSRYRALKEVMNATVYEGMAAFFCGLAAARASGGAVPPPLVVHVYPTTHPCFLDDGQEMVGPSYGRATFASLQSSAALLHFQIAGSDYAARSPGTADLHWIPHYSDHRTHGGGATAGLARKLDCLAQTEPLYARRQGHDHIATLTNDYGPCKSDVWYRPPRHELASPRFADIALAVFNGETESAGVCFRRGRDIVLPPMVPFEYLDHADCRFEHAGGPANVSSAAAAAATAATAGGTGAPTRPPDPCDAFAAEPAGPARVAFMSGQLCWRADPDCAWYSRGVRQRLHALFGSVNGSYYGGRGEPGSNGTAVPLGSHATPVPVDPTPVPAPSNATAVQPVEFTQVHYHPSQFLRQLQASEFGLCAPGYALWSPRPVEALWAGTIPALVGLEHYVPPFADLVDWSKFSVAVGPDQIPDLVDVLDRVSAEQRRAMRALVRRIHHIFRVLPHGHRPGQDAVDMLMFQLWWQRGHA